MTELKYDPELPFVVLIREDHGGDVILARCSSWDYANQLAKAGTLFREVVDTTPKPKIPEDAEFVHWDKEDQSFYAMRYGKTDEWWVTYSRAKDDSFYYLSDLLILIGDSEVTVLVRKEDV